MYLDPSTELALSMTTHPGAHAVLVGAGGSVSAGMPSAWAVQRDLILRIARAQGEVWQGSNDEDEEAPFAWFKAKYGQDASYDRLLAMVASTPTQRMNLLRPIFTATEADREQGRKVPTAGHAALADLVKTGHVRLIVTLNFDHLIEEALRDAGIDPVVVNTAAGVEGLQPLHEYECLVVHLHGDYTNPEMRNTPDELATYPDPVQTFLRRLLSDYGLVVFGWSGQWDPALRDAIDGSRNQRFPIYWVTRGELQGEGAALARRKSAVHCPQAGEVFLGSLRDKVRAIEEKDSRHPLDSAALVNTAKRELENLNRQPIQTHDSLRNEFAYLRGCAAFRNLMTGQQTVGAKEQAVEAAKPLAALVATLAYWGSETTDRWWKNIIPETCLNSLYGHTRPADSHQVGGFLYVTALVAAIAGGRDHLAAELILKEAPSPGGNIRVVDLLGPRGVTTPQRSGSLILFDMVRPVLSEHLLLPDVAITEAWETWEYLALTHIHHLHSKKEKHAGSWTPHLRRHRKTGQPLIATQARERLLTEEPWLASIFADVDRDKVESQAQWTADLLDKKLLSVDKYRIVQGAQRLITYYDD